MAVMGRYKKPYHAIHYLCRSTQSNTEPARTMWITYPAVDNQLISGVFRFVKCFFSVTCKCYRSNTLVGSKVTK